MQCDLQADRGEHRLPTVTSDPFKNEQERMMRTLLAKTRQALATILALAAVAAGAPSSAKACGTYPIIGDVCLVSFGYCPSQYAQAAGQVLRIADYPELFTLLGTTYGGDGTTTFALPDLRGLVSIGVGQGPGQPAYALGQTGGTATVTPSIGQLPLHTHDVSELPITATTSLGGVLGIPNVATPGLLGSPNSPIYRTAGSTSPGSIVALNPLASTTTASVGGDTEAAGNGEAQENRPHYLSMLYCIALQGSSPDRR